MKKTGILQKCVLCSTSLIPPSVISSILKNSYISPLCEKPVVPSKSSKSGLIFPTTGKRFQLHVPGGQSVTHSLGSPVLSLGSVILQRLCQAGWLLNLTFISYLPLSNCLMDSCTELSSPHFEISLSKTVQKLLTFYASVEKRQDQSMEGVIQVLLFFLVPLSTSTIAFILLPTGEESMFVATTISSIILHIDNEDKEQLLMSVTILSQCILTN